MAPESSNTHEPAPEPKRKATRDELTQKAREAELKRQQDVVDAVAKTNETLGEEIGGPLMEPGLGR